MLLSKKAEIIYTAFSCHPGYTGVNCTDCIRTPGCVNGFCDKPLQCICRPDYFGDFCERAECRVGCDPVRGFCERPGECWCRAGYIGDNCTQCMRYPGCVNGDCDRPWQCNCRTGFTGPLCDVTETPSPAVDFDLSPQDAAQYYNDNNNNNGGAPQLPNLYEQVSKPSRNSFSFAKVTFPPTKTYDDLRPGAQQFTHVRPADITYNPAVQG